MCLTNCFEIYQNYSSTMKCILHSEQKYVLAAFILVFTGSSWYLQKHHKNVGGSRAKSQFRLRFQNKSWRLNFAVIIKKRWLPRDQLDFWIQNSYTIFFHNHVELKREHCKGNQNYTAYQYNWEWLYAKG